MAEEAKEKLEGAEHREDASTKDSEEMPVWAADMMKKMDAMSGRMDAMEKGRVDADKEREDKERADKARKDESEEAAHKAAEELEARKKEEDRKDSEAKAAKEREDKARADAEEKDRKEREDRARADSAALRENRELKGKIEALEAQVSRVFREPSYEDRNALAEARARADATYRAVTGKPASEPIPGESPISYRKRMADGLRKFSEKFKEERVDSLSGPSFDAIEGLIYADAQAAAKRPDVLPAGTLRAITRNDSGHTVTEYLGDPKAAWGPFTAGAAVGIALTEPRRA